MTFSPPTLQALGAYWQSKGGVNLGVVGDLAHKTGYHCGKDRLFAEGGKGWADYSVKLPRDKAGLTNAAAAIDLGKLGGTLQGLQAFSVWLADQCRAGAPGTSDVREIIFSPDGNRVLGWTTTAPAQLIPDYGDSSHRWHSHVSWFRDSENRDKTGLFSRYWDAQYRVQIASSARIEIAVYDTAGNFTRWSTATWGPTPSSAPCEAARDIKTTEGLVRVARVTGGKYSGRDIRLNDGVKVVPA